MRLTAPQKTLLDAVTRAARVADNRSTMPILAHVLVGTGGCGNAVIAATDLYLSTSTTIETSAKTTAGSISLPARDLVERIKAMPAGDVTIDADGTTGVATITAAGSSRRYKLHGVPGSEFPSLPEPGEPTHSVPASTLQRLLAETHYAISTDETRAHINSLLLEIDDVGGIRCVSTDGHRLSMSRALGGEYKPLTALIPLKGVLEIKRAVDAAGDTGIAFGVVGPVLFFRFGATVLGVKTADAVFPPWKQVVPEKTTATVTCSRAAFADACRAVSLASSERTGGVKLVFGTGEIRVCTESAEGGEGYDAIPADCEHEQTIGVNAGYLLDVCSALTCDEIAIGVSGELDPVKIAPAGVAAESWEFDSVVMPCRL